MKNIFEKIATDKLYFLASQSKRIAIISHTNPDGDAVGSGLALTLFLRECFGESTIRFFVPNHFPEFLAWVDPNRDVEIYNENYSEVEAFLAAADLIIIADFNQTTRLDKMGVALDRNFHAPRVLIDHHVAPPKYDLSFHTTQSSSTAFLVYNLICAIKGTDAITTPIANAIYMGMMTDTGGFSFGNLTPDLYRAVAVLVEKGVDAPAVNRAIFNNQSEDRLRMVGYLINQKLVINREKGAAYFTLTEDEKQRFNHQIGDTEGIVNIPLTVKGINFSAILIQTKDGIKISLRSIGDLDVNVISNRNFNGGGHVNAAGGKFFGTMEQAIEAIERVINEL